MITRFSLHTLSADATAGGLADKQPLAARASKRGGVLILGYSFRSAHGEDTGMGIIYAYLTTCLGWAPHFPYAETGRYRDTRAWKSPVGTLLSMGMEYHRIHHLFPTIPLLQTGPAYWEMRELLAERGVRDDRPDALPTNS